MDRYLQPLEIIKFFTCEAIDFKTTNHELVKRFGPLVKSETLGPENHQVLKKVTSQLVVVIKTNGHKYLQLKPEFQNLSSHEILRKISPDEDDSFSQSVFEEALPPLPKRGRSRESICETVTLVTPKTHVQHQEEEDDHVFPLPDKGILRKKQRQTVSVKDLSKLFDNGSGHVPLPTKRIQFQEPIRRHSSSASDHPYKPLNDEEREWILAACRNDQHIMLKILAQSLNPSNLVSTREHGSGNTALHWCCKYGNVAMIDTLVGKYKASVAVKSRGGYTPLMIAAIHQKTEAYNKLVELYGADPEVRDYSGRKAKQYLLQHSQPEFVDEIDFAEPKKPEFERKTPGRSSSFFRALLT